MEKVSKAIIKNNLLPVPLARMWTSTVRSAITDIMRTIRPVRVMSAFIKEVLDNMAYQVKEKLTGEMPKVSVYSGEGEIASVLVVGSLKIYDDTIFELKCYNNGNAFDYFVWTPDICTFRQFLEALKNDFPELDVSEANLVEVLYGRGEPLFKAVKRLIKK